LELFRLEEQGDGTVAIASAEFEAPVCLRMDGTGVTQFAAQGGGTVNAKYRVGPEEKFRLEPQGDGTVAIASVQFPGVYLRLDGTGVTQFAGDGGGVVNCQFGAGPMEKFWLLPQD
jgi:phospholipase C